MCGRYAIQFEEENVEFREIIESINQKYAGTEALARMKTGEIFPTETVPVLIKENSRSSPLLMEWGFPRWQGPGVIINARAETAAEKATFRDSILSRRCLLPSTGFYEWTHAKDKKNREKFLLRLWENPVLYMAGIYKGFKNKEGAVLSSFVILTTAANEWVSPLHNRMPLILSKEQSARWLQSDAAALDILSLPCETQLCMESVL